MSWYGENWSHDSLDAVELRERHQIYGYDGDLRGDARQSREQKRAAMEDAIAALEIHMATRFPRGDAA